MSETVAAAKLPLELEDIKAIRKVKGITDVERRETGLSH